MKTLDIKVENSLKTERSTDLKKATLLQRRQYYRLKALEYVKSLARFDGLLHTQHDSN